MSRLNQWLRFVDKKLSPEAFMFLKFGLHSELRHHYSEVDGLDKPSQLYRYLLKHRGQQSESEVLKMFIHVLKGLGGKLRGNLVLREGFGEDKLKYPGDFDIDNASSEFRFFQCLLQILTQVRKDSKLSDRVKTKLCKGHALNTHAKHYENLPELFIALYQEGCITAKETNLLKQVLMKYEEEVDVHHKEEVHQCLAILDQYHSSVGLPLINLAEIAERRTTISDYLSSDGASAVDTSSARDHDSTRPRFKKPFYEEYSPVNNTSQDSVKAGPSDKTAASANEPEDDDSDFNETKQLLHVTGASTSIGAENICDPEVSCSSDMTATLTEPGIDDTDPTRLTPGRYFKISFCLSISFLLALFVAISITVPLFKIWLPLKPLYAYKTILDGSPAVVTEMNSLFHEIAVVALDRVTDNFNSSVDFYVEKGSCDAIAGVPKHDTVVLTKTNISEYVLKDYALKGSVFYYQISGKVKFVNVCAHRLDHNLSSPEYCSTRVLPRQGLVPYQVIAPGYYYFRLEQDITDYHLMINESLMRPSIDQGERVYGCTINSTNVQCQIHIPFIPFAHKYCILAKLYQSLDKSRVKLVVQVKESRSWIVRGIAPIIIVISLILLPVFSLLTLKFCNFFKWLKNKFCR